MFQETTALKKILSLTERIKVVQGGTSAGKTIAILLYLINLAQTDEVPTTTDILSETMPHIKLGSRKDFIDIMTDCGYFQKSRWNIADNRYTFETGSIFRFIGVDQPSKVRGPRRDRLFINECNNVPLGVFEQTEVRTKEQIILDFNPVSEFWVHTDVIPNPKMNHDFIKLTYRDNEALDPRVRASIESRKHNKNWWRIYGEGEIGVNEGQVYDNWQQIDSVPEEARLVRRGLDFGYTNHPTALVAIYKWNEGYIFEEELYRAGMTNPEIAQFILSKKEPEMLVIADSAEPKSIEELKRCGVNVAPAMKGPGSVNTGIDMVKDQTVSVPKTSPNVLKESRNYLWKLDKDNNPLNVPEDVFNHAMDAARYGMADILDQPRGIFEWYTQQSDRINVGADSVKSEPAKAK